MEDFIFEFHCNLESLHIWHELINFFKRLKVLQHYSTHYHRLKGSLSQHQQLHKRIDMVQLQLSSLVMK